MTYEELMNALTDSRPADWLYHDSTRTYVYKENLSIRIQKRDLLEHQREYTARWTEVFDKPYAEKAAFDIYYGASPVRSIALVEVDEGRAILPIPSGKDKVVEPDEYAVARCLDRDGTLDNYMERAGIRLK